MGFESLRPSQSPVLVPATSTSNGFLYVGQRLPACSVQFDSSAFRSRRCSSGGCRKNSAFAPGSVQRLLHCSIPLLLQQQCPPVIPLFRRCAFSQCPRHPISLFARELNAADDLRQQGPQDLLSHVPRPAVTSCTRAVVISPTRSAQRQSPSERRNRAGDDHASREVGCKPFGRLRLDDCARRRLHAHSLRIRRACRRGASGDIDEEVQRRHDGNPQMPAPMTTILANLTLEAIPVTPAPCLEAAR